MNNKNLKIGELGEQFVRELLVKKNWNIIDYRWRCLWGEIDIIAQENASNIICFIEVKTRNIFNIDRQGIDSITIKKQEKIIKSAESFLSKNPQLANNIFRFDVALVSYTSINNIALDKINFQLEHYIKSAFELD